MMLINPPARIHHNCEPDRVSKCLSPWRTDWPSSTNEINSEKVTHEGDGYGARIQYLGISPRTRLKLVRMTNNRLQMTNRVLAPQS